MKKFKEYTLEEYNNELSSKKNSPSGGTTSALLGIIGLSNALMAINLSNVEYDKVLDNHKDLFYSYMEKDREVLNELMLAYKNKSSDLKEKIINAINISKDISSLATIDIEILEQYRKDIKKILISDLDIGLITLRACVASSEINCKINEDLLVDISN